MCIGACVHRGRSRLRSLCVKGAVIAMSTQMAIGAGDTADDTVGDTAVADAVAGGEGVNDTVARLAALPGVGTASGIALRGSASGGERGRASRSPDGAGGPGRACEAGV